MGPASKRPNLLVFLTDQQRWDTCGCYRDSPLNLTPNLDRMAATGTLLKYSFTVQPVCAPARACLQTGLYATQHGVWRNGIALDPERKTLAHHFNEAGYHTAYIGKWHLAATRGTPVPRERRGGYQEWLAADALELTSDPNDFRVFDTEDRPYQRKGYRVDAQTECVIEFLNERARRSAQPFFVFASYVEPHQQNGMKRFVAPDGYAERYRHNMYVSPDLEAVPEGDWPRELPDYYGMCANLDENLGRVLDTLTRLGLEEDTVVFFGSDHGCHFRTRNREYKRSCHEASIRVPSVLHGPGFQGGHVVEELVGIPDWTATLLDAAGLPVPTDIAGRSVLPLVRRETAGWPQDLFVQISESQVGRALRTKRWKYGVTAPGGDGQTEPQRSMYVEQYLYDLDEDPWELHNLAGHIDHSAIAEELAAALTRRMIAAGERKPDINRPNHKLHLHPHDRA
jgi:arylsulfatase A-like enzyme